MKVLRVMVHGQSLTKADDFGTIVSGSKGYLRCAFQFTDTQWDRVRKIAVFEDGEKEEAVVLDKSGQCDVPDTITNKTFFRVRLVGVDKERKLMTERLLINQRR